EDAGRVLYPPLDALLPGVGLGDPARLPERYVEQLARPEPALQRPEKHRHVEPDGIHERLVGQAHRQFVALGSRDQNRAGENDRGAEPARPQHHYDVAYPRPEVAQPRDYRHEPSPKLAPTS